MKRIIVGLLLSVLATTSYAQSTIQFNVAFNKFYAAAGNFVPELTEFSTAPITLTAQAPLPLGEKVIILLTDGIANTPGGEESGKRHAYKQADTAAEHGIRIQPAEHTTGVYL